ncbi:GntR family transcriptional regulator [Nocardia brasiliensis]|uniref:GntR family transcriptional regulator n=1 Tax=Nocardia brasiliensis TaxID=37326 RepID=UPI002455F565|nr:GntR family transcriptional regulator [Nocardia brasiliensis]
MLPKYLQIAGYLRDQIVRGDLAPGSEVPSVRVLAAEWKVARPTASKALDALRQQGLVESRRGSGTYVRGSQAAPRARERYERAAALGTMYSDAESIRFPFVGICDDAPPHVVEALGLAAGSPVLERQRIIEGGNGPVELSTSWFAAALVERAPLLAVPERLRGGTVRYLADVLGIRSAYARDQVCARPASSEESEALGLPEHAAVLVYWLTAYDTTDRPLQFDEAVYPPERWAFRQEYPIVF